MRLETQFIRTFVLNCTKLRTSSNSHPCHPRDGDDYLSAIFFASFLSKNLEKAKCSSYLCTRFWNFDDKTGDKNLHMSKIFCTFALDFENHLDHIIN